MSTIQLDDIKYMKKELEKQVAKLLHTFESKSGLEVTCIDWQRESEIGSKHKTLVGIDIEAVLR